MTNMWSCILIYKASFYEFLHAIRLKIYKSNLALFKIELASSILVFRSTESSKRNFCYAKNLLYFGLNPGRRSAGNFCLLSGLSESDRINFRDWPGVQKWLGAEVVHVMHLTPRSRKEGLCPLHGLFSYHGRDPFLLASISKHFAELGVLASPYRPLQSKGSLLAQGGVHPAQALDLSISSLAVPPVSNPQASAAVAAAVAVAAAAGGGGAIAAVMGGTATSNSTTAPDATDSSKLSKLSKLSKVSKKSAPESMNCIREILAPFVADAMDDRWMSGAWKDKWHRHVAKSKPTKSKKYSSD